MNPKKFKFFFQKGKWNTYQLFKISQPNAKNWIFGNLIDIDLYPAGTLGPLEVKYGSKMRTNGQLGTTMALMSRL